MVGTLGPKTMLHDTWKLTAYWYCRISHTIEMLGQNSGDLQSFDVIFRGFYAEISTFRCCFGQ